MKYSKKFFAGFAELLRRRPIRFFAIATTVFGMLFLIAVPPFQIPDEFTHFTRAYEVSELKTAHVEHRKDIDHLGTLMPRSILKTYRQTSTWHKLGYPDVPQARKYSMSQSVHAISIPLNQSDKIFYDTGSSPSYFPVLYVPQAALIAVMRVFDSPVILMLYATRILGLLIWLVLAVLALKVVQPTRRVLALGAVLLLPMFVAQSSASTDPLINGLAVLYVALIASHFIKKTAPSPRMTVLLTSIVTLMTLSKPVYGLFGFLFLLLSIRRSGLRSLVAKAAVVAIPFVVFAAWSSLAKISGGPYFIDSIAISHADPSQQLGYLIPNVFNFFEPFVNTLFLGWGDNVAVSLVGEFGKLDTPLPLLFIVLGISVILMAIFTGTGDRDELALAREFYHKKKTIILVALVIAGYIGGVYLAMYLFSTPPKELIVTGVQGRYLLPLIPLLVLFASKYAITVRPMLYRAYLLGAPVVLLVASLVVIYLRYYVQYP